jgi:propanol-preferring alcohol dehydrogenase
MVLALRPISLLRSQDGKAGRYLFTRPGDLLTQKFALQLGVTWAGGSDEIPPEPLDAAIVFATVGDLIPVLRSAI